MSNLQSVVSSLNLNTKVIAALDESPSTIAKRLTSVGLEPSTELAQTYREDLVTTENIESYVGGVILYPDSAKQIVNGQTITQLLLSKGIGTFVKVDTGLSTDTNGLMITKGHDTLGSLLDETKALGAVGSKWRAYLPVGDLEDSSFQQNIIDNITSLSTYAKANQDRELIPIVEPEISYTKTSETGPGGVHTIEQSEAVAREVLHKLVTQLQADSVDLSGIILKIGFVLPGKETLTGPLDYEDIARRTLSVILDVLPVELSTIVFLSGGLESSEATECLRAINKLANETDPTLSASYGRGLQSEALKAFAQNDHPGVQSAFLGASQANATALSR